MSTVLVDKLHKTQWQKRWDALHAAKFANDYKVAELGHEIRSEFPKGEAGDLQFSQWILKNLRGARPKKLLEKIRAFETFDERQWERLGGWDGITFLMGLTTQQRARVIAALPGEGPFHRTTIRMRALQLGIFTRRKTRSTRADVEVKIQTLRVFILNLYKKRQDLPAMPPDVKAAITPGVLSVLSTGARA